MKRYAMNKTVLKNGGLVAAAGKKKLATVLKKRREKQLMEQWEYSFFDECIEGFVDTSSTTDSVEAAVQEFRDNMSRPMSDWETKHRRRFRRNASAPSV